MNSKSWLGKKTTVNVSRKNNNINYLLKNDKDIREVSVSDNQLLVDTSSELFDALFALAVEEANQNCVENISDWSFESEGNCCFETGKKWNYVWTRDTAYSVHLGIGEIDPIRAKNSMEFKLSPLRSNGKLQIVQDTGTGGSWPLSTDRVVWALGASELLKQLSGPTKISFEKKAIEAIEETVLVDREYVYDKADGLYRGEQSFLDWREQTYPIWTKSNTTPIGESKTLSTNICHYYALKFIGEKTGGNNRYKKWALELKKSINNIFWSEEEGLYRSMILPSTINEPLKKYDLLGNALAVILEVADSERASKVVSSYPHTEAGAPVVHPQLREVPIYHNRGIWPFVSCYAMLAAKKVNNEKVFSRHLSTLMTAATINLSNMENMEFLTLSPWFEDGDNSGPVVNSERQLWSVAGYLNSVISGLYGIELTEAGLMINPFVPAKIRNYDFEATDKISLKGYEYRNRKIDLVLNFPQREEGVQGVYRAKEVFLNNKKVNAKKVILHSSLTKNSVIEVTMELQTSSEIINHYDVLSPEAPNRDEMRALFAPEMPVYQSVKEGLDFVKFGLTPSLLTEIAVFRNGNYASTLPHCEFVTVAGLQMGDKVSLIAIDKSSKLESHPTEAYTFKPQVQFIAIDEKNSIFNTNIKKNDSFHEAWGATKQELCFDEIKVDAPGMYRIEVAYRNLGPENTGITACVKWLSAKTKGVSIKKICFMPHREDPSCKFLSSAVELELNPDYPLSVTLKDAHNMSALAHFEKYTKRGGKSGADNTADIFGLKITKC